MNAKILSTNKNDTTVEFVLSDGSKSTQTIANVPVHDEAACAAFLKEYVEAYERGLEVQKAAQAQPVVAEGLVGKSLDLTK